MPGRTIEKEIKRLSPWFHNIHLPGGEKTAPDHPLGDFPSYKWEVIAPHLPQDMSGKKVLDIGCNAGFYSVECARRGAQVTAIDIDPHYLKQAKWVAGIFDVAGRIEFHRMQVYDLAKNNWQFDIILFMGVFYHLRYPLLALDIIAQKVRLLLVFQTLSLLVDKEHEPIDDFNFDNRQFMLREGWPTMAFIENKFMGDPTNWWVPNPAAVKAMCRTTGLEFMHSPGQETFFFRPGNGDTSVMNGWNRSEYLAATGKSWVQAARMKTGTANKKANG